MGLLGIRQKGVNDREIIPTLTPADRCDRCRAPAMAVVVLRVSGGGPSTLLFCHHHANQYEPALKKQGAAIYRKEL